MKKRKDSLHDFDYQGVSFHILYIFPNNIKNTDTPCLGRINPIDPATTKAYTKHQIYGSKSNAPLNFQVRGKDKLDIWNHKKDLAASSIIALMKQNGLIQSESTTDLNDDSSNSDLSVLAKNFQGMFFMLHRSEWGLRTVAEYTRQYEVLAAELSGIQANLLDGEKYRDLQETICYNALKTARKVDNWRYGDEPPASARKRLSLLYELIQDLKQVEGVPIPVIPTRYNSKPSRQQLLLDRIDSARSLPYDFLHTACVTGAIPGQLGILADGGLRISELAGLLFSCLHAIDTSQGTLYYIEINGQLTPSGKRTEITKTAASYRIVPLSPELGEELNRQRQQLEEQLGDLAFRLMCGQASCDEYIDTPAQAAAWQKKVGEQIPELLRSTSLIDAMVSERAYVFNLDVQNKYLFSMITCHALRRNYCTWLYCYSGLCTSEIYRLMGHSDKARPKSSSEGLTDTDLRRICLQNYVSHTLYHTPGSLTYSLSNTIRATEVPACNVNLILPPKATINLILEDTEPSNRIHYSSDGILVEEVRREKTRNPQYDYSLLASDEVWAIKDKHKLLD